KYVDYVRNILFDRLPDPVGVDAIIMMHDEIAHCFCESKIYLRELSTKRWIDVLGSFTDNHKLPLDGTHSLLVLFKPLLVVPSSETLNFTSRFKHVEKIALGSSRRHTKALHSLEWNAV